MDDQHGQHRGMNDETDTGTPAPEPAPAEGHVGVVGADLYRG